MALTYKWFRCVDCGYSGEITTEEIAAHRSRCARGTTEPIAEQARAAEQGQAGLVEIGTLRARLFAPFDCLWNGLVRDFTAADEIAGGLCNAAAVTEALIRCVIDRAHLDRSFPERHESGLRGLFDLPQLAPLDSDFKHEEDCPCFGDEPEHSIDCKNCTCDKQPAAGGGPLFEGANIGCACFGGDDDATGESDEDEELKAGKQ